MHHYSTELAAAREAARLAAGIILELGGRLEAMNDAPVDVSTQADRDSQDAILNHLSAAFPNDAFRAEEQTETLRRLKQDGRRLWIIDPIDGTRGFVQKIGEYSVMIALVDSGDLVLGVVAEPAFQRQMYAVCGQGCWRQDGTGEPRRVRVTSTTTLRESTLIQSHVKPGKPQHEVERIAPAKVVETYSAGVKLARVADGSVDMYVCNYPTLNDWDLAAGHILVTEAGGRVTTLASGSLRYGEPSPAHHGGLLATNGLLHDLTVSALVD